MLACPMLCYAMQVTNATAGNVSNATMFDYWAEFCRGLINSSTYNGTNTTFTPYSPYCDPCLRPRLVVPRPFNHTALSLVTNRYGP